jgi:hypothetical protein
VPGARARVDVDMAQLLPRAARRRDKVGGVLVAENLQRLVRLAQLDRAVRGEVAARRVAVGEVAAGEQRLRAIVVAVAEVGLREPECVGVVVYGGPSACGQGAALGDILVSASSLSATNMAESYWCRLSASWRHSRRYFSIMCYPACKCVSAWHRNAPPPSGTAGAAAVAVAVLMFARA